MRIVVTGATGNHGTSLLEAMAGEDRVDEIVGIARRVPREPAPKVRWEAADVSKDDLVPLFRGADVVVHLAWLIQPSRDEATLHATNVVGTHRVAEACVAAGVPALVHASSIGAYSPGPKDRAVDESHPTGGISTSFYSRHKSTAERILRRYEDRLRLVVIRPGLVFKREAGAEIRRLFIGPLFPSPLANRGLLPVLPVPPGLVLQAVHSKDLAQAYLLAALDGDARGPYNVAADPVLTPDELGRILGARHVSVPAVALRALTWASWTLRLQPTPPGWLDMGLGVPVMDITRARTELGWTPQRTAGEALLDLLDGLREGAGMPTPALDPDAGGPLRIREFTTGVGGRNP